MGHGPIVRAYEAKSLKMSVLTCTCLFSGGGGGAAGGVLPPPSQPPTSKKKTKRRKESPGLTAHTGTHTHNRTHLNGNQDRQGARKRRNPHRERAAGIPERGRLIERAAEGEGRQHSIRRKKVTPGARPWLSLPRAWH